MRKSLWQRLTTCVITGCYNARDFQGHHLRSRGAGGSDGPWNRLGVCRIHHIDIGAIGLELFCEHHPEIKQFVERAEEIERIWQLDKVGKLNEKELDKKERNILTYIRRVRKTFKRSP